MRVIHATEISARCPVTTGRDTYNLTVRTNRLLLTESIAEAVVAVTREPVLQEELTQRLANRLCCEVETVGFHGQTKTTVVCTPGEVPVTAPEGSWREEFGGPKL